MNSNGIDILLVLAPPWDRCEVVPLGPAYLMAAMKAAGLETDIWDLNGTLFNDVTHRGDRISESSQPFLESYNLDKPIDLWEFEHTRLWLHGRSTEIFHALSPFLEPFLARVMELAPRVVGFSVYASNLFFTLDIAAQIKHRLPKTKIVIGGPWNGIVPYQKFLRNGLVDVAVMGEGEAVLPALVRTLSGHESNLKGARIEKDGELTLVWPTAIDVEATPIPSYADFDISLYRPGSFATLLARGCPNRCYFCTEYSLGPFRPRSKEAIIEEWSDLHSHFGLTYLFVNDATINGSPPMMRKVFQWVADSDLKINYESNASFSPPFREDDFHLLKATGCSKLIFGLESASDSVLKHMHKRNSPETASATLQMASRAGVESWLNLIVGYPTETEADFVATKRFIEDHAEYIGGIQCLSEFHLIPGSQLVAEETRFAYPYPHNKSVTWSLDSLTFDTRRRRLDDFMEHCERLGLTVSQSNRISKEDVATQTLKTVQTDDAFALSFIGRSGQILVADNSLTETQGIFFDWDLSGKRRFSYSMAWDANQQVVESEETDGLSWCISTGTEGDAINMQISIRLKRPLEFDRVKVSIVLKDDFQSWKIDGQRGSFDTLGQWHIPWRVMGPADPDGLMPLADGYAWTGGTTVEVAQNDPDQRLAITLEGGNAAPVLQTNCNPGVSVGWYRSGSFRLPAGDHDLFKLKFRRL